MGGLHPPKTPLLLRRVSLHVILKSACYVTQEKTPHLTAPSEVTRGGKLRFPHNPLSLSTPRKIRILI